MFAQGNHLFRGSGVNHRVQAIIYIVMWFWGCLPDLVTLTQLPSSEQLRIRNANKNIVIDCN